MPVTASAEAARATRRRGESNGATFWHTTFIGANRYRPDAGKPPVGAWVYPMAFLVEQDPGVTVAAHFHQSDQFQVVTAGHGRLGAHEVGPISVHFSAAFSAYGPIRASGEGLDYFTLRNGWDLGARYMPGARAELPRPRRHRDAVAGPMAVCEPASLVRATPRSDPVLEPQTDGLGAWRYRLPKGEPVASDDPRNGGGQFWVVLAGSLVHAGKVFGAQSCLFVSPDEPGIAAVAGDGGSDLLALRFPRRFDAIQ